MLAEARRRNRAAAVGATSVNAYVAQLLHVSPAEAARLVGRSRVLEAASTDPVTASIASDASCGAVPVEQAVVAAQAVASLPAELDGGCRGEAVAVMRAHAAAFDPVQLARVGQRLITVVDPESGDRLLAAQLEREERTAARRRDLVISAPQGGLVRGRFLLPAVDAAVVVTALRPLAAPHAAGKPGDQNPWTDTDPAAPADGTPTRDDRTHGQRMADALVELCSRTLTAGDLPDTGGERPQLVVTVDLDRLRARTGAADLLDGTPVPPSRLRQIACDTGVIPAVLGSTGQPLDIGRETRTIPTGLRRALTLRDRGCAFPGCDRPPTWCEAHHINHWADGGPTALHNLVLLCSHHHRHVHTTHRHVTITADGHPRWRPPDDGWPDGPDAPHGGGP